MEIEEFEKSSNKIEKEIWDFERALRTSFNKENPRNYIVIQSVNIQCQELKRKVENLLRVSPLRRKWKAEALFWTAMFYINKYEEAINRAIDLDWDILYKLWSITK